MKITELLDKTFKGGYEFGGFVDYGKHSGTSIRGSTFEELKADMHKTIRFYSDNDPNNDPHLGILYANCLTCLGAGRLPSRINKRGVILSYKKCPDCRGVGKIEFE